MKVFLRWLHGQQCQEDYSFSHQLHFWNTAYWFSFVVQIQCKKLSLIIFCVSCTRPPPSLSLSCLAVKISQHSADLSEPCLITDNPQLRPPNPPLFVLSRGSLGGSRALAPTPGLRLNSGNRRWRCHLVPTNLSIIHCQFLSRVSFWVE